MMILCVIRAELSNRSRGPKSTISLELVDRWPQQGVIQVALIFVV
jgi:hypothetical protein